MKKIAFAGVIPCQPGWRVIIRYEPRMVMGDPIPKADSEHPTYIVPVVGWAWIRNDAHDDDTYGDPLVVSEGFVVLARTAVGDMQEDYRIAGLLAPGETYDGHYGNCGWVEWTEPL